VKKKSKWLSRKLLAAIATPVAATFFPELLPLLKVLAPAYIIGQGAVDIAAALVAKTDAGE
jgi:hypothetical protein